MKSEKSNYNHSTLFMDFTFFLLATHSAGELEQCSCCVRQFFTL